MVPKERVYKGYDNSFLQEFLSIPGGDKIQSCIQCGSCSGSCPTSAFMEHTPRKLFAMIRANMRDEVLGSNTMWYCVSCYNCYVRCPKSIKITDIMYALKCMSQKENKAKTKGTNLAKTFVDQVQSRGRINETQLMVKYFLKTSWIDGLKNSSFGMKMKAKGRLPLITKKVKNIDQIQKIVKKVDEMGGV